MQQQTGVPPIIMQHAQPAFMHPMTQSQHAWIMSAHVLSPLVHVIMHPLAVISILHMPIIRLQLQTIMPFIVQHRPHIPPAIMAQRFCIMVHAAGSSHEQVIFIPPGHFSTFIAHRGTIIMFGAMPVGIDIGMPMPIAVLPVAEVIGFIIAVMVESPVMLGRAGHAECSPDNRDDNRDSAGCNCDTFGRHWDFESRDQNLEEPSRDRGKSIRPKCRFFKVFGLQSSESVVRIIRVTRYSTVLCGNSTNPSVSTPRIQ
jgi:hypothetical protein